MDILPYHRLPGKIREFKEVVHHHLANHIVASEAVEVVDAEVQLAVADLVVHHRETEGLVEHGVQVFAVDTRLELLLPLRQQVDLHIGVGGAREVFGRQVQSFEDPHHQSLLLVVVTKREAQLPTRLHRLFGLTLRVNGLLLVEFGFYSSDACRGGLAERHCVHAEVDAGDIHLTRQVAPERIVPVGKGRGHLVNVSRVSVMHEWLCDGTA